MWAFTDFISVYTPIDLALKTRNYPAFSPEKTLSPSSTFYSCPLNTGSKCNKASFSPTQLN